MSDVYRSGASVLLVRPAASGYELLLLHKPRKKDAWQLPQGGVEAGETLAQAALRELEEEAGIVSCTLLGESERVYQYDFPTAYRRFRPDNVCGQKIGFIFASAAADTPVHVDAHEVNDFVWVDPSALSSYVRREEYAALVRSLYDEAMVALQRPARP